MDVFLYQSLKYEIFYDLSKNLNNLKGKAKSLVNGRKIGKKDI